MSDRIEFEGFMRLNLTSSDGDTGGLRGVGIHMFCGDEPALTCDGDEVTHRELTEWAVEHGLWNRDSVGRFRMTIEPVHGEEDRCPTTP